MDKLGLFFKLGAIIILGAVAVASIVYWFTLSPRETASSQILPTPALIEVAATATESERLDAEVVVLSTPVKPAVEILAPAGIAPAAPAHARIDSPDPNQHSLPITTSDGPGLTPSDGESVTLVAADIGFGVAPLEQNTPLPLATTSLFSTELITEEPQSFVDELSQPVALVAEAPVVSFSSIDVPAGRQDAGENSPDQLPDGPNVQGVVMTVTPAIITGTSTLAPSSPAVSVQATPTPILIPASGQTPSIPVVPLLSGSSVVTIAVQPIPDTPVPAPEVGERAAVAVASAAPRTDATARQISPVSTPTPIMVLPGGAGRGTPTPLLPFLIEDGAIYRGPDGLAERAGILPAGQMVDIVARDTTGSWYLLANGYWIATTSVANVPPILPLVVPTPTPTITPTGLPTDTPTPLPVDEPSPTPSPTPTSLDVVICDCSEDQYECLGSYFPTQAEAQLCFEYCFRQTGRDIHELDLDGNGRACENLD